MSKTIKHINKKNLITLLLSLMMLVVLFISVQHKKGVEIEKVTIRINKLSDQGSLISRKDVLRIFRGYLGYDILMANLEDLDLQMLETVLTDDARVKQAELYVDSNHRLNVYIKQRKPIVRVNSGDLYQYYLDEDAYVIPVAKGNPIRVPIASGNIEGIEAGFGTKRPTNLKAIYKVANFVQKDKFLSAFIEQIYVRDDNTIVAIPKVGKEKIIVGDVANLEESFRNMKIYYRKTLPKNGWHEFAELNLSYKNQVVSTKKSL